MTKTPTTYSGLVEEIIEIILLIITVLLPIVFIFFIWKIIDAWIINAGDEKKHSEGKVYLTSAVLVFVIMISAWGIVAMVRSSLFGL